MKYLVLCGCRSYINASHSFFLLYNCIILIICDHLLLYYTGNSKNLNSCNECGKLHKFDLLQFLIYIAGREVVVLLSLRYKSIWWS